MQILFCRFTLCFKGWFLLSLKSQRLFGSLLIFMQCALQIFFIEIFRQATAIFIVKTTRDKEDTGFLLHLSMHFLIVIQKTALSTPIPHKKKKITFLFEEKASYQDFLFPIYIAV